SNRRRGKALDPLSFIPIDIRYSWFDIRHSLFKTRPQGDKFNKLMYPKGISSGAYFFPSSVLLVAHVTRYAPASRLEYEKNSY
ncbi:MAG: hypothetical protein U9R57_01710, partial [Thermodesulfobacteriota bacterium]|nr:hypothetical protein [Thermodesulfobacteriota bacterium]